MSAARPPQPRSRPEQRIREATERLLAHTRARDLTIEDLLREADVSRRTFYLHYSSKYAVVTRLALVTLEEAFPQAEPFFAGTTRKAKRAALQRGIGRACAVWAQHRTVLRAVMESWLDVPELHTIWLETLDAFTIILAAEIDAQRAAGAAPAGADSRAIAQTLVWSGAYTIYL
ncbi:MAG: TetR/AcrR family transcriptional regulator, ethionamide resistance regulator, partial [Thermoleophilaceae bacterium]|nr:TetR/AcrR family transcriptional regulator, ethionamide resistance regulator [Thermoleophilaceae bacterium]